MPHNLVTLSLCCAARTCSEVPISSSDRDTTKAREGRPHSPSLGHPCPGAGSSFTQREVTLTIGYPLRVQRRQMRHRITPGIPPFLAVASVDRTQQGIWGWPVQSPRHPQELILPPPRNRVESRRRRERSIIWCRDQDW